MAQIMIVEDNQGTNKAICEYLKTAGHGICNLFLNKALPFHRRAEFFAFNTGTTLPLYPFNINRVFYCTKGGKVIDF